MTLEDFFTLTEMKDGLTTPARVEDLVSMMREEKDSIVKNVSEAARQWCTVASTLAATESKDSLDHFIHLNGLYFLDWWLQEAQKCSDDTNDSSLEELIGALLGALKKLPIDKEMSVSSGIGVSVKNLFGHKSFRVQETARALLDSWNQGVENDLDDPDVEKDVRQFHSEVKPCNATVTAAGSGCLEHSAANISPGGIGSEDYHVENPDVNKPESPTVVKIPVANDQNSSYTKLSRVDEDRFQGDARDASIMPTSFQENVSTMEESSSPTMGRTDFDETCSASPVGKVANSPDAPSTVTVPDKATFSPDTLGKKEIYSVSTTIGPEDVSSADRLNPQQSASEPPILNDVDTKESESYPKGKLTVFDSDASKTVSKPKSEGAGLPVLEHLSGKVEVRISDQDGEFCSNVSQDLSDNGCILRRSEDKEASFHEEDVGALDNKTELDGESNLRVRDSAIASYVLKPNDTKMSDRVEKKRLEMELDFVVDDALEVARQVAKEVEREVVDYREPLCSSSSEKNSEGIVLPPKSPDSVTDEQEDLSHVGPQNEVPTGSHSLPGEAISPKGDDSTRDSKSMDRTEDCVCNQNSSQVTEAPQEPAQNTEKNLCDFDLNEEVHSEEIEHPKVPISPPITVAASKAALHQLAAPRHFGGEQGWKGSAATSAFRPASPRKIPEKALSVERNSSSSKQRQNFLDIDLNVAGVNNDGASDPVLVKQIPASSGLPSGESSIEVSSRRAERLKLDLNRVSEDEDGPLSDCRMDGQVHYRARNGHHSPSPTSSSSSRQPSMRNIDLNDSPCVFNSYDQGLGHGESSSHACGGVRRDDPVISIMGARVVVDRKEMAPQAGSFLPNGQVTELPSGANIARSNSGVGAHSALAYSPAPGFVYDGLTVRASTSVSPIIYGSTPGTVPFRVDSRVPVVPHIMSSPVVVPPAYTQSPFLVSMTSLSSGFSGVGSRQSNLDLNSGWAEGGDGDRGSLRQFLMQAPATAVLEEEDTRSASQPSSSGMRVKRREPDGGWDSYPVVYKQQARWH